MTANAESVTHPGRTTEADLDLLRQLVCSCSEDNCARREVVDRVSARVDRTADLARRWAAEAAERDTPKQQDTIYTGGAADMVLAALGVAREPHNG